MMVDYRKKILENQKKRISVILRNYFHFKNLVFFLGMGWERYAAKYKKFLFCKKLEKIYLFRACF